MAVVENLALLSSAKDVAFHSQSRVVLPFLAGHHKCLGDSHCICPLGWHALGPNVLLHSPHVFARHNLPWDDMADGSISYAAKFLSRPSCHHQLLRPFIDRDLRLLKHYYHDLSFPAITKFFQLFTI